MSDVQVIVGIDNGVSGGLCAISSFDGSVINFIAMPTEKVGDKPEVSIKGVLYWLDQFSPLSTAVAIEEPLRHAKSSQAMRSMSISFGKIIGLCETVLYPTYRIQVKEWQDVELGKRLAKGQTKVVALAKAQQYWPDENWLATSRSKVPHDGIVDSALIARYYLHYRQ
jgi:hypothetical protein